MELPEDLIEDKKELLVRDSHSKFKNEKIQLSDLGDIKFLVKARVIVEGEGGNSK